MVARWHNSEVSRSTTEFWLLSISGKMYFRLRGSLKSGFDERSFSTAGVRTICDLRRMYDPPNARCAQTTILEFFAA